MSRLVNIVMVCVWLVSQVLVVSFSQAHAAMGHQQEPAVSVHAPAGGASDHHHLPDAHHSQHGKSASSESQERFNLPHPANDCCDHSMAECCDIACQTATVLNSSELSTPQEASRTLGFALRSVACWSPGSINPPPNTTI